MVLHGHVHCQRELYFVLQNSRLCSLYNCIPVGSLRHSGDTLSSLLLSDDAVIYLTHLACDSSRHDLQKGGNGQLTKVQWNLELRTQSVPGDGSTFELNFPIRNNVN
jgi:hypothetical protein